MTAFTVCGYPLVPIMLPLSIVGGSRETPAICRLFKGKCRENARTCQAQVDGERRVDAGLQLQPEQALAVGLQRAHAPADARARLVRRRDARPRHGLGRDQRARQPRQLRRRQLLRAPILCTSSRKVSI